MASTMLSRATDDSIRSIKLIMSKVADCILEGKQGQAHTFEEEKASGEKLPKKKETAKVHAIVGANIAAVAERS